MIQENKVLLLKDISARLPYGIILNCCNSIGEKLTSIDKNGLVNHDYDIEEVKPYLFPFSSMTVEQKCKAQNLLPDNCSISFINSKIIFYGDDCHHIELEQFDKLFKFFDSQHVDYRGLIEKGLAIDCTNLNIY